MYLINKAPLNNPFNYYLWFWMAVAWHWYCYGTILFGQFIVWLKSLFGADGLISTLGQKGGVSSLWYPRVLLSRSSKMSSDVNLLYVWANRRIQFPFSW